MKITKKLTSLALSFVLVMTACADLDVTNTNAPDQSRALASPADVESLIKSTFLTWWQGVHVTVILRIQFVRLAHVGCLDKRPINVRPQSMPHCLHLSWPCFGEIDILAALRPAVAQVVGCRVVVQLHTGHLAPLWHVA